MSQIHWNTIDPSYTMSVKGSDVAKQINSLSSKGISYTPPYIHLQPKGRMVYKPKEVNGFLVPPDDIPIQFNLSRVGAGFLNAFSDVPVRHPHLSCQSQIPTSLTDSIYMSCQSHIPASLTDSIYMSDYPVDYRRINRTRYSEVPAGKRKFDDISSSDESKSIEVDINHFVWERVKKKPKCN
eukprot:TRINITY_DN1194_c0_g1_i2.p1 TRINITY_DN1194_c0_g1~~TRINITY_DN1194_c0_g1_i2.p1  ORF type:complete len:182 (+),score=30.21 TRINITY_DN1194_c0_g1_i2:18-563(+)